ncbi:MAG: polyphosphate kinase 1 [Phycisphaerae bacterium]|nr:polyphosphate kinase 1 [Phycisphaerae bacterium]
MTDVDLNAPELFINRELSWLEFNHRVLMQGCDERVPLMERLKFLAIASSNLDEFFMIRVAGLKQQQAAGVERCDIAGYTPSEQLNLISERVHRMVAEQSDAIARVFEELTPHGLKILQREELTPAQRRFLATYFETEVLPVLTPLSVRDLDPFPAIHGLTLNLAVLLTPAGDENDDATPPVVIVPIPGNLPRFATVRSGEGLHLVRLEHLVRWHIHQLFPQRQIVEIAEFRLTRDADVAVDEDAAADLLQAIEAAVLARRRRAVVRLDVSAEPGGHLRDWLTEWLEVDGDDVYEIDGLLDATALMKLAFRSGFDSLKDPYWPPQPPMDLPETNDIYETLQQHDVLLCHPYESFDPVVALIDQAADDSNVLAIKQTLYRTSGESPVIDALARAAERGKQVTVLVELKARFDEARNVIWARQLEDAGCQVIYGVAGLKTHGKLLLIVRREPHGIRRYVHASTGNYNDRTAQLYSDIGLMTSDQGFAADAAAFFNLLTGVSEEVGWQRFATTPRGIRCRFVELIDREIRASTVDHPGLIMVKVNSLQDKEMCQALYRASQAGVKVLANVRGICCLRPGVKGTSGNIRVTSIVDRYLEHARIFYFRNGGNEEVYLSSADWMRRNLDRRLEILFPVDTPPLRNRLVAMLNTYFADNVKAYALNTDGTWTPVARCEPAVRAQEVLRREAVEGAKSAVEAGARLRPLTRPESYKATPVPERGRT